MGYIGLLLGFILVAFGQPAWIPQLAPAAAICGYALMWCGLQRWQKHWQKFLVATLWFLAVQAVNLSWMTSTEFVGKTIFGVYGLLTLLLGLQMGLVSLFIYRSHFRTIIITQTLLISSLWVFMEYARLYILSGYTFSPIGLALSWHMTPMQIASVIGVYGLSWLVMASNVMTFHILASRRTIMLILIWALLAGAPYFYGYFQERYHLPKLDKHGLKPHSALLVQTSLNPEEKCNYSGRSLTSITPFEQWQRILSFLQPYYGKDFDFIVLPEETLPISAYLPAYYLSPTQTTFSQIFGEKVLSDLPPSTPPLGTTGTDQIFPDAVTNAYWAQCIANIFNTKVIIGLDTREEINPGEYENYASALAFHPQKGYLGHYDKQILVPMVEYLPLQWAKDIVALWGIYDFYTPGKSTKVFQDENAPFGISICYEETFGNLIRQNKQQGAKLLVNITNDGWYPNSRLPRQHFALARLRSVENGIPMLRSCNTGITCAVDSLGQISGIFSNGEENTSGAFPITVSSYTYNTIYSEWGDKIIMLISSAGLSVAIAIKTLLFRI